MTNLTPMLSELHRIFDALNEKYFNNELPNVFITITPGKKKTSSIYPRQLVERKIRRKF